MNKTFLITVGYDKFVADAETASKVIQLLSSLQSVEDHYVSGTYKHEYIRKAESMSLSVELIDSDLVRDEKTPDPTPDPAPVQVPVAAVVAAAPKSVEIDPGDIMNQALRHSLGYEASPEEVF